MAGQPATKPQIAPNTRAEHDAISRFVALLAIAVARAEFDRAAPAQDRGQ